MAQPNDAGKATTENAEAMAVPPDEAGADGEQPSMTTAKASADLFSDMVERQRRLTDHSLSTLLQGIMRTYGLR